MGQAHLRLNRTPTRSRPSSAPSNANRTLPTPTATAATCWPTWAVRTEAVAAFDQALRVRPDNPEDLCNRGSVLADLGRTDEALTSYERALSIMPGSGAGAFQPRRYPDAVRPPRRGAGELRLRDRALPPNFAEAHANRGSLLTGDEPQRASARPSFERAAALDPRVRQAGRRNTQLHARMQRREHQSPPPASRRSGRRGAPAPARRGPRTPCSSPRRHAPRPRPPRRRAVRRRAPARAAPSRSAW